MQHCHHIAFSISFHCSTPPHHSTQLSSSHPDSSYLPARFFSPLPVVRSSKARCLFASFACIPHNCLLAFFTPQDRPVCEGLNSTALARPFLSTNTLCSGCNNLPKSVPGLYPSPSLWFSLRGTRTGVSEVHLSVTDETTFHVV